MYWTPDGERILLGAERRLFEESLGMIVDLLSTNADCEFGVQALDELQPGQKLFALYSAARALLNPSEPAPKLVAFLEGAVAAVYRFALDRVVQEIGDPESTAAGPSWRSMVLDAIGERDELDDLPDQSSADRSEWELLIESLEGAVLWDDDFEALERPDLSPEASDGLKRVLGISKDYYTEIPCDVPDNQMNLYIDALKGLTPRGRGWDVAGSA